MHEFTPKQGCRNSETTKFRLLEVKEPKVPYTPNPRAFLFTPIFKVPTSTMPCCRWSWLALAQKRDDSGAGLGALIGRKCAFPILLFLRGSAVLPQIWWSFLDWDYSLQVGLRLRKLYLTIVTTVFSPKYGISRTTYIYTRTYIKDTLIWADPHSLGCLEFRGFRPYEDFGV